MEDNYPLGWAFVGIILLLTLGLHFLFDLSWLKSAFIGLAGAAALGCVLALSVQLSDIQRRLPL